MFQPDLFAAAERVQPAPQQRPTVLTLPGLLERLTTVCERPRYSFMVFNLIAQAIAQTAQPGPMSRRAGAAFQSAIGSARR